MKACRIAYWRPWIWESHTCFEHELIARRSRGIRKLVVYVDNPSDVNEVLDKLKLQ